MKVTNLLLAMLGLFCFNATAFPKKMANFLGQVSSPRAGQKIKKRQSTFDPAAQLVSTTGSHAWVAPNFAGGDQRGPCPGLNALANHGYLPHNGVADITTMTNAVNTGKHKIFTLPRDWLTSSQLTVWASSLVHS